MFGRLFGSKTPSGGASQVAIADAAFRDSVLLVKLLEANGASSTAVEVLTLASARWRHTEDARLRTTGLSLLRFLFKAMHVAYSKPLLDEVLGLFASSNSVAARLAALDVLGAMSASPNPVQLLSADESKQLIEFRDRLMRSMNTAQRNYANSGVQADVGRALASKPAEEALTAAVERIGRVHG